MKKVSKRKLMEMLSAIEIEIFIMNIDKKIRAEDAVTLLDLIEGVENLIEGVNYEDFNN